MQKALRKGGRARPLTKHREANLAFPHFIKCGKCPSFADTKDQFEWAYARQRLYTAPYTIKEFVEELDAEKPEFRVKPG